MLSLVAQKDSQKKLSMWDYLQVELYRFCYFFFISLKFLPLKSSSPWTGFQKHIHQKRFVFSSSLSSLRKTLIKNWVCRTIYRSWSVDSATFFWSVSNFSHSNRTHGGPVHKNTSTTHLNCWKPVYQHRKELLMHRTSIRQVNLFVQQLFHGLVPENTWIGSQNRLDGFWETDPRAIQHHGNRSTTTETSSWCM